tara:strand:- start:1215 stop:1394 length:180 start_codon:yes stop_codon:yes gene_type:complete
MSQNDNIIEKTMLEIVSSTRRIHFNEGTSATHRTKKLKEIIENNSEDIELNAIGENNDS